MRGLQLTKTNKIFFILVCIMTLSCNTNSNYTNNVKAIALESSHQAISNENNQQKIEDEELVLFLDNLKKALLEKQIDEITNNMINYSLRSIFCFSKSWIQRILLKIGFLVGGIRKKLQILIFPFYQKILSK